jgi:hypothetical protein
MAVTGGTPAYPVRRKSAHGWPKPETSIGRCCRSCGASFIGLAPGKTGEVGIWHDWRWYCSLECDPARPGSSG